ncbi:TetR/AcrR family transcriptional regulator [Luteolibacter soli]|uniref:TetR/AcrR family transcriptional regulator n=1 Tax=Luteolibacter soli TaxID=3135280 RepID=A0ABU9ASZ3_9BACT
MSDELPLPERILDAAEVMLRRHGAEKANVVDIARLMEMSHGNIYRHFPSKKAILDAVAVRWLQAVSSPLQKIANESERSASERLEAWFHTLRAAKRRKVLDDPELFRVYHGIAMQMRAVADEHVATLHSQLEGMIADGIARGEFSRELDAKAAARAFMQATMAFHHPLMLMQNCPTDEEAHTAIGIILNGLKAGR